MTKRIGAIPFRELLAHSIADDPTVQAAADVLDAVMSRTTESITDVLLYGRLATDSGFIEPVLMLSPMERLTELRGRLAELPADILDMLAWQLHVDTYDTAVDLQAKRELVAVSMVLHRKKGTPWTVVEALDKALQLHSRPTLTQWFEYEGRPFYFRVYLDVSDVGMTDATVDRAIKLILEHKNVRSWLDLLVTRNVTTQVGKWIGVISKVKTFTYCQWVFPTADLSFERRTALFARIVTRSRIYAR